MGQRISAVFVPAVFIAATGAGQTTIDLRSQTRNVDFGAAASTRPVKTGAQLPAQCALGELFFNTSAPMGSNLYACTSANVWTAQASHALNDPHTYGTGAKQTFSPSDTTAGVRVTPGLLPSIAAPGDIAVDAAQGNRLKIFDGAGWVAAGGAVANYSAAFGAARTVQVAASTHGFESADLIVECYDNGNPAKRIEADLISVDPATYTVTIQFQTEQTGRCVINGQASAASGGRSTGGDVSGDISNVTVLRLQGRAVSQVAPSEGQALVWDAAAAQWKPGVVAKRDDFSVQRSNATELAIGESCSAAKPCNVRFGDTIRSFTSATTAHLAAGTGTAYIYVNSAGVLTVGHNATVTCSAGCVSQSGITGFPVGVIPLHTWTATNGVWDLQGGVDRRAWLNTRAMGSGTGIMLASAAGRETVAVDTAVVPTYMNGSAALDFPGIANGVCAAEKTFPVPGAAVGEAVIPGWPSDLPAGLMGMMRVTSTNTVSVRLCNASGSYINPPSIIFRATVFNTY